MKKYVVTAASVVAGLSMITGAAHAQTGTVGVNYTKVDTDFGDSDSYGINGAFAVDVGTGLAVLVDGSFSTNDDSDVDLITGTAHLIARDADSAWGGFAGIARVDAGAIEADAYTVGGEYARFFDTSTFAAQLAYATIDDTDVDILGLTGEYRIFSTDDLRFDIMGGWAQVDTPLGDSDGFQVGVGVEHRFAGSPISIGGNVTYLDGDGSDATVIGATLRFDFGNASLKARDRKGNTFGSFGGLSTFLQ
jgi:hypothetical protein